MRWGSTAVTQGKRKPTGQFGLPTTGIHIHYSTTPDISIQSLSVNDSGFYCRKRQQYYSASVEIIGAQPRWNHRYQHTSSQFSLQLKWPAGCPTNGIKASHVTDSNALSVSLLTTNLTAAIRVIYFFKSSTKTRRVTVPLTFFRQTSYFSAPSTCTPCTPISAVTEPQCPSYFPKQKHK